MDILSKINTISLEKNIPISVSFEVTKNCPLNCVHCYIPQRHGFGKIKKELGFKEVSDILLDLKKNGTIFLNITGGEPLLRDDIISIIKKAVKLNFYVKLFTSLYVADYHLLKSLYNSGLREIDVSLYGNKKVHNLITRFDSFDKTVENIFIAKKLGFIVTIKMPLMKYNIKNYKWVKDFAKSNGLRLKFDPIITPLDNGVRIDEKISVNFNRIKKILKEENITNNDSYDVSYFPCGAIRNVLAINSYGDLYPCLAWPYKLANLKVKKLSDILNSKKVFSLRNKILREPQKCVGCLYKSYCSRCIGISYLYGDEFFIYPKACELAKTMYGIYVK